MYIFETSWEVCNRVGGIYAVLSTRAASMQRLAKDKVLFFGPDLQTIYGAAPSPYFREDETLFPAWRKQLKADGLKVRIGRWLVPGEPIAVLVDFSELFQVKDGIYAHVFETANVRSHAAYGDYDESSLFGWYVGMCMEHFLQHGKQVKGNEKVCAHFNEWQTAFGLFYMKEHCPQVGTLFTTHATGIGRSIAGNNKPLYDYFTGYNGDQMAEELNMVSKHSAEKQAAHWADCFTTVSDITAKECQQLLDKPVDIVTPNGFEPDFVPKGPKFNVRRKEARAALKSVAEQVLGYTLKEDTMFVCTSGRYEWRNKGIDAYLHALRALEDKLQKKCWDEQIDCRHVVAFVMVPAWQSGAKKVLGKDDHWTTHALCDYGNDPVTRTLQQLSLWNTPSSKVKVVFVPSYLNGSDGIFNKSYYDLLIGMDATVFPSYYEPWGYTPLESVAFHVPTITTDKAGFGLWAEAEAGHPLHIEDGVEVVERTDSNWQSMIERISGALLRYLFLPETKVRAARKAAASVAEKAEWSHFFAYYEQAYAIALGKKH